MFYERGETLSDRLRRRSQRSLRGDRGGSVLLTENVADFTRISVEHLLSGQHHPGVLIALSSRLSRRPTGIPALVEAIAGLCSAVNYGPRPLPPSTKQGLTSQAGIAGRPGTRQPGQYSNSRAGIADLVEMLLHSVDHKLRQKLLDDTRQAA